MISTKKGPILGSLVFTKLYYCSDVYYTVLTGQSICLETEAFYQSNSPNELSVQSVPFGATYFPCARKQTSRMILESHSSNDP